MTTTAPEQRDQERKQMAQEDMRWKELMAKGVIFPQLSNDDEKVVKEILKIAAMARQAATAQIGIRVLREGRLVESVDPVGNFDVIFQALLYRKLQSLSGSP